LALEKFFAVLEHLGDSYVDNDPALAEGYYLRLLADNPALKFPKATSTSSSPSFVFGFVMSRVWKRRPTSSFSPLEGLCSRVTRPSASFTRIN
jgi:hypothetical protein